MSDTILILGAGSGMARAVGERLAAQGHNLLLAGRDTSDLRRTAGDLGIRFGQTPQVLAFDAADLGSHAAFFDQCLQTAHGELDGVVLCYGLLAHRDQVSRDPALARRMIDVNYTSPVVLLDMLAGYMEKRGRGYLCVLSSVAGDRGRPSNYHYGATKAALSAYLDGLRAKLFPAGVAVITIKPGPVDTAMTWGLPKQPLVASPQRVAADICRAIRRRSSVVYTPWCWRPIMALIRAIPQPVFKRMKL